MMMNQEIQPTAGPQPRRLVLAVYVRDLSDALRRITSMVCRKGFSLESLSTSPTEHDGISRVMISVLLDDTPGSMLVANLSKLWNVVRVEDTTVARPTPRVPVDTDWIGGP